MNLEQAQLLRKELLYLEGLIAWNTREYIWRVVVGPLDPLAMDRFQATIDPGVPFNPKAVLQPFRRDDLSVYFFLKHKGAIIFREYRKFLTDNNLEVPETGYVLTPFPLG